MPQDLSHGVNVRPVHPHPARSRVSQIVELKVFDFRIPAGACENLSYVIGDHLTATKDPIGGEGFRVVHRSNGLLSEGVQIHDAPLSVLRLRKHNAIAELVYVQPTQS